MSDKKENLCNAQTAPDPHLNFDYNELLSELTKEQLEPVDPKTEVTISMLARNTGISENAWRERMKKLVKACKVVTRQALGMNGNTVTAYRKAGK